MYLFCLLPQLIELYCNCEILKNKKIYFENVKNSVERNFIANK